MPGRRGAHAYNPDEIERLKCIPLPEKIKCGKCQKNYNHAKFSIKQLTNARSQVKTHGKIYQNVNCQNCTGQQIVELECNMCFKTKGLEAFAKSQRSKPDTATCFDCTQERVDTQPINEDKYEDNDKAFIPPEHSAGQYPEYFSSTTSSTDMASESGTRDAWEGVSDDRDNDSGGISLLRTHSFSNSASSSGTLIEGVGHAIHNDGWSEVRTKSWRTQSVGSVSTGSGFNANCYGNPSVASSSVSGRSFASSVAERSEAPTKWPKIRAYTPAGGTPCGTMRPMKDADRDSESLQFSDEEEEQDNDDDDDSDDDTVI